MLLNLIVPIASDKEEYNTIMPRVFGFYEDGTVLCVKAIEGLDLSRFENIYYVILRKHNERYSVSELLQMQFRHKGWKNAKVVILDSPTRSQAETVYQTIKQEGITGGIFVKDSDGYFECDFTMSNGIATYPLDYLDIVDPKHKSYVSIDNQYYITNIIEKKIISRFFNAGGYLFDNAQLYCSYYERFQEESRLYLSHLVYAMLLDNISFRPFEAENYIDWNSSLKQC